MHVTIVGAGALGRIYGVRLAAAGEQVSFVVREARLTETSPFVIERVGSDRRDVIERPHRVAEVPGATAAVIVAVRFDQLEGERSVAGPLRSAPPVPIVMLTPLLPRQRAALEEVIGRKVVPGMPSTSGYLDERDVVRYWIPRVASTLLEEPNGQSAEAIRMRAAVEELARRIDKAGIPAHLARDVASLNVATTISFFPLIAAIDAGEGVEGVLADKDLLSSVMDAAKECDALAHKLGKSASWANLLMRFVGPYTLKPGVKLARTVAPEAVKFVEAHFGPKLHGQHLAMGDTILALGGEHGVAMPALAHEMDLLRTRRHPAA
ncbi:MAG: 2-dehydropantoate 2-reductase N-terminal domain-containing protein [Minicystis sp.]